MNRLDKMRVLERLFLDCHKEEDFANLSTDFNCLLRDFMEQVQVAEESNAVHTG